MASWTAVPESATVALATGEVDATTRVAARAPGSKGMKPTVTVHVPPGCTVVPEHVSSATWKSSTPAAAPAASIVAASTPNVTAEVPLGTVTVTSFVTVS